MSSRYDRLVERRDKIFGQITSITRRIMDKGNLQKKSRDSVRIQKLQDEIDKLYIKRAELWKKVKPISDEIERYDIVVNS